MITNRLTKSFYPLALSFLLITFLISPLSVLAQNAKLPEGVQKITSVEGITEYRLPNGLRVLLFPDQTKQTITVNVTYLVGSRHENYGETGMAHLLEHLVFKGTSRYPNIPAELTSRGARPNGTTWVDRTNYFETFAASEDNLNWALDLEADRMVNSFIAKKDLDSEMTVVRNEIYAPENADKLEAAFKDELAKLLKDGFTAQEIEEAKKGFLQRGQLSRAQDRELSGKLNNYLFLNRTIAWDAELESKIQTLTAEQINAAMRKYLTPDNITIIKAGDFAKAKEKMKPVQ